MNRFVSLAALCAVGTLLVACGGSEQKSSADMRKVLRVAFQVAESGFDPQAQSDLYSSHIWRAIFEPLYELDYLARPAKFIPRTAVDMPVITDEGKTWTIKIKPGIFYMDDPAFNGKPRELTAEDYVFGFKRFLDPKVMSPRTNEFLEFGFIGAEEFYEKAKKDGWNPDLPIEGLKALDKYTLQFKLKRPDPLLMQYISFHAYVPIAREVWEKYKDAGNKINTNPVGTGPYYLKQDEWIRASKIVLEANPKFRGLKFPETSDDPADKPLIESMRGKTLPAIGRIEISIIEESNPRLLAFKGKRTDIVHVPPDLIDNALPGMKLAPDLAAQNVQWQRVMQPALSYTYFNMEDPVVGGYTKDKIALRRAIIMSFDTDEYARLVWRGHAEPASQIVPPPNIGHDKSVKNVSKYDPEVAKRLLDKFGYVDRDGDGYREQPDGSPLKITFNSTPTARDREIDEFWKKSLDAIGIRAEFNKQKWPDLLKQAKAKQLQTWGVGWFAALPDGLTFASLLHSERIGQANYSNFKNEEFDRLFEQARYMQDSPERTRLIRRMNEIANAYSVWENGIYRYQNTLVHPWVLGYKKHPFIEEPWWMYDIDLSKKPNS